MLHNEARELLVKGYEATHDAEGIAKAYSVSKWTVYRLAEQKRKTGSVALRTIVPTVKNEYMLGSAQTRQGFALDLPSFEKGDPKLYYTFQLA